MRNLSSLFRKLDNVATLYQKLCRISHLFIAELQAAHPGLRRTAYGARRPR